MWSFKYSTGYPPLSRVDIILAKPSGRWRPGSTASDHKSQLSDYYIINGYQGRYTADRSLKLPGGSIYFLLITDKELSVVPPTYLELVKVFFVKKVKKDNQCIQTHNKARGEEGNAISWEDTCLRWIDQIKQPMQKQFNNNILVRDYC
jgi:hypothetical protein